MKNLLVCIMLFLAITSTAQQKRYYYDHNGKRAQQLDSSGFIRIIHKSKTMPDNLYDIEDYYPTGKIKMQAHSTSDSVLKIEGKATTYYLNGKIKEEFTYQMGRPIGEQRLYYPNGILAELRTIPTSNEQNASTPYRYKNFNYTISAYYDTTGKALATNGNGYYARYTDPKAYFAKQTAYIEGNLVNNLKHGQWKTTIDNGSITLTERYTDGQFLFGVANFADGYPSYYTEYSVAPEYYAEGKPTYFTFELFKTLAARHITKPDGLSITITLDAEGCVSEAIVKSADKTNKEVEKIVLNMQNWTPEKRFGRAYPINFEVIHKSY